MKKLVAVALLSAFSAVSICASAADLSGDDRSELRQRAEAFQAERARNPEYQPGQGRVNLPVASAPRTTKSTIRASSKKTTVKKTSVKKTSAKSGQPETRRAKVARKARAVKNVPGAFVRK